MAVLIACAVALLAPLPAPAERYTTDTLAACVSLDDAAARLACYDRLAGRTAASDQDAVPGESRADDSAGERVLRSYSTRRPGEEFADRSRGYGYDGRVERIRIVVFARDRRRYVGEDGRRWRPLEGETLPELAAPFDAELSLEADADGYLWLRPSALETPIRVVEEPED